MRLTHSRDSRLRLRNAYDFGSWFRCRENWCGQCVCTTFNGPLRGYRLTGFAGGLLVIGPFTVTESGIAKNHRISFGRQEYTPEPSHGHAFRGCRL